MAQYELNLRDYVRIARKRKGLIIFTMISLGFFSYFFANMQKPVPLYSSFASVKVERATTMTGLYLQTLNNDDSDILETQSTVITSLPLMEIIAKRMGYIDEKLTPQEIRSNRQYLDSVLRIKNMISTNIEGWTNIINIEVTGTNPKEVQELANTAAAVFKEENTAEKNKRTIEGRKFIEKRLSEVEDELASVQGKIKNFKENNRFINEMAEVNGLLGKIERHELSLEDIRDNYDRVVSVIAQLEDQISQSREKSYAFAANEKDSIFTQFNDKRSQMLTKREVLMVNYTDKYNEVVNLDVELRDNEANLLSHLKRQKEILLKTKEDLEKDLEAATARYNKLPQLGFTLDDLEYELENARELYRDLSAKHQEILIQSAEMVEEVSIVRPALEPRYQINPPKVGATTGIGTMIGLVLGIVIAFILETLDTSIGTIEDVEAFLNVPVLGVIPLIRPEEIRATIEKKGVALEQTEESLEMNARLITHFAPKSNLAESFRALRTSIKFLVLEKNIKTLMISSSTAREGKSTTMANIALTLAQIGSRVLLVDADLRKPMVARVFGIEREPGLSDIILGNYEWKDTVKTVTDIMMGRLGMEDIMTSPGIDNLNIITAGTHSPNTTELVSSQRMSDFLESAKEEFDIILIDCPPVLQATDSVIISTKVDAAILIYWAGKIQRGALKRAKTQLDNVNAQIIGVVLNGLKPEVSSDYKYYGYYSYYGYGGENGVEKKPKIADKIKERFMALPFVISSIDIFHKSKRFAIEKGLVDKFNKLVNPIVTRYKIYKPAAQKAIEQFLAKHIVVKKALGKLEIVKKAVLWISERTIYNERFRKALKIIITILSYITIAAGFYWQMFLM